VAEAVAVAVLPEATVSSRLLPEELNVKSVLVIVTPALSLLAVTVA